MTVECHLTITIGASFRSNNTAGHHMDSSVGNVDSAVAPQPYEVIQNTTVSSGNRSRESIYLDLSPHYRETNGSTYSNVSKPYEVMNVAS